MNQQKTGEFLKRLRKDKGLTQEQLAEQFCVSSRTVSRWETGSNMPELSILIELADFYDVDIREIIDGERKSENMDKETKDTLKKVAEYAAEEKKKMKNTILDILCGSVILLVVCTVLFQRQTKGLLYGIVPENICAVIMFIADGLALVAVMVAYLYIFGVLDKIREKRLRRRNGQK